MKILVFTEGTILMHSKGIGRNREEIVQQVQENDPSVKDYATYVPVGNAAAKLQTWERDGTAIEYLTSRKTPEEIAAIQNVLDRYDFPKGELHFRKDTQTYAAIAELIKPNVLIEDDCESIGGQLEMTYPNIRPEMRRMIQLIEIKEFGGIDYLPDNTKQLLVYGGRNG